MNCVKRRIAFHLFLFFGLSATGQQVFADDEDNSDKTHEEIVVASKKFTENVILGEIARAMVHQEHKNVRHQAELGGSRILWLALNKGEIHIYPEYTGTLQKEILSTQAIKDFGELRTILEGQGIGITDPLGFNNSYVIGMSEARAGDLGIRKISDLRSHPQLRLGFSNEFINREDGWQGLSAHYHLGHKNVKGLDHDLAYRGLDSGVIDAMDLYATDAEIQYYGIRSLDDDKNFFTDYHAVYLYRLDLTEEVIARLDLMAGRIGASRMVSMNAAVKLDGQSENEVAADFIHSEFNRQTNVIKTSVVDSLLSNTSDHLQLVFISLSAAILVAIPLGILAAKTAVLGQVILGLAGILQTIPSLALFVFMIPLLGIGAAPTIAALFIYSLLPIIRNTYAGLHDISPGVRDSARALGLSSGFRLRRIELPLAMRSILAGVKTSAVINVGTATLGALIGAGGYGQPILTGIRLDDTSLILQGAIPAALLALLVQALFELIERYLLPAPLRESQRRVS